MEEYVAQLIDDIKQATLNFKRPQYENELLFWIPDEEDEATARIIDLQEWTGIYTEMLPPESSLNDEQLHDLLEALKKMLDEYNWSFFMFLAVPDRIQYRTLRENFNQEAKIKQWHKGYFQLCSTGTEHKKCCLGQYCHCAYIAETIPDFKYDDEYNAHQEFSSDEERDIALEIQIRLIKKRYGRRWKSYYPYHLDRHFDDDPVEDINDEFGFGDDEEEDCLF